MSLRRFLQVLLAVVVATLALSFGSAAGAVDNPDYSSPPPSTPVSNVLPASVDRAPAAASTSSGLALTGADIIGFVVVGGVLVAGGAATLAVRRRTV